jgi:CTP synthase
MVTRLENAGLSFTGKDETGRRMEIVELPTHPYYIGVQFHPEYKSRPGKPSALFLGLIAAACGELDGVLQGSANRGVYTAKGPRNCPLKEKLYQNGTAAKPVNILSENIYSYLNGVHI